jgi:NAD(P)H dehydrogenase (quinone)
MTKKILITLATGRTGYAIAKQLLTEGYEVRIYVRSKNSKAAELQNLGAEIAMGEFGNREQFAAALFGIDAVYYCYPYQSGMSTDVTLFIEEAQKANIKTVVFLGQRIAEYADTGSSMTNEIRKSYELFTKSNLNTIFFVPGYFADNAFVVAEFILQLGIFPNPFGNGKNPWISNADMSRCIVSLLKKPELYYGKKLFPTGDKSICANEMNKIFSKVRGKKVIKINIPNWLFFKAGIMTGKDFGYNTFATIQADLYNKQMQMNRFDIEPTNIVKELTGREPESFETITRQYFEISPFKVRTFTSWLKTFIKFNKLPFTKVPTHLERKKINQ